MKTVLLTGATGFIGRHCVTRLIELGYEVHAVSSREHTASDAAHWHRVNLLDERCVDDLIKAVRPSHLLHLAWFVEPGAFWTDERNVDWVEASIALFRSFSRYGGKRAVIAGTCAEYDWHFGLYSELRTPCMPATLYGAAKHGLHVLLEPLAAAAGVELAWGRIFFLYGPHEPPTKLTASVIRSLLQQQPARCTHGRQVRDFLHVADVADAFVALLNSGVQGPVNIASGTPVTIRELAESIARMIGAAELLQLGARPAPAGEPPVIVADVERLRREVKWSPRYTLEAGLVNTIEWWRHDMEQPRNT